MIMLHYQSYKDMKDDALSYLLVCLTGLRINDTETLNQGGAQLGVNARISFAITNRLSACVLFKSSYIS